MNLIDVIIGGNYRVEGPIQSGSFGNVYKGRDLETSESVAFKMEPMDAKHPRLRYEAKLYQSFSESFGVPSFRWFGKEKHLNMNVLIVDLLGPSLQDLLDSCGGKFSLKTVLLLADQMINRIEWLHSRSLLHRDIKPENFAIGVGEKAKIVHMIDFGLAKKFRDKNLEHISYGDGKRMIGTLQFASLQAHLGIEQGRRDDLESLGYVLMYFLRGNLPWQTVTADDTTSRNEEFLKWKMSTSVKSLCAGFPHEFEVFLSTCKNMRFREKPDYSYLKNILRDALFREGYRRDFTFDWAAIDLNMVSQLGKRAIQDASELDGERCSSLSSAETEDQASTRAPSSSWDPIAFDTSSSNAPAFS
jgi:casein kinase I family protein HRR25